MGIKALPGTCIVRREAVIDKIGLIFLPETQVYKNRRCQVVDAGPVRCKDKLIPNDELKPGDFVAVVAYDGTPIDPVDDPNLLMVENDMIMAVLGEDLKFDA